MATIQVAEAVPVAVPVGFSQQMAGAPTDNSFLLAHKGLYVRQHLELVELLTGCETKNRYALAAIPAETEIPTNVDSNWSTQFRQSAGFNPLLKAKEQSECFERICCPLFRGFTMDFVDGNANAFMTISRPFKCDPCYCPGLCLCNPQELSISSAGKVIATAKETTGPCCTTGCCLRQFTVTDHSGALMYKLEANECCSKSGGCNCCAPTCFNQGLTIDITSASGELLEPSTFVWPGCNCGGLTDLTNMVVQFPVGSNADERASILAGMMLIEFTVMEMRRQNDKNNNGGGGGGTPANQEMAR